MITIVAQFGLRWGEVADRLRETPVLKPVDPLPGSEFDLLQLAPGASPPGDLRLEKADDRFVQSVIVGVSALPAEGSIAAPARRSVWRIEKY